MSESARIKINGVEKEVPLSLIGADEVIASAFGLVREPTAFVVSWKRGPQEGRLLPSEKMYPVDGMEFTISHR